MPKILVMTDAADGDSAVLLSERVAPELLESGHYATQFVERVRGALQDATQLEEAGGKRSPRSRENGAAVKHGGGR